MSDAAKSLREVAAEVSREIYARDIFCLPEDQPAILAEVERQKRVMRAEAMNATQPEPVWNRHQRRVMAAKSRGMGR